MKQDFYSPQDNTRKPATFGKWNVSSKGDMSYDKGRYCITSIQLLSNSESKTWIAHLFEKAWIDWNDFIPAYFQALKNLGRQEVSVTVFYPQSIKK